MARKQELAEVVLTMNNQDPKKRIRELTTEFDALRKKKVEALLAGEGKLAKDIQKEMTVIKRELKQTHKNAVDVDKVLRNLNKVPLKDLHAAARILRSDMQGLERDSTAYIEKQLKIEKIEREIAASRQKNSSMFSKGLMVAGGALSIKAIEGMARRGVEIFASLDDKMADVIKTTGLTKEQVRQLDQELMKIDTRTSREDFLDLARIGGKLGLDNPDDVLGFVRAAEQIRVALADDLGGDVEEAVRKIGKLTDIFHLQEELGLEKSIMSVASAINALGADSTASEQYLVEFTNRTAGVAPAANISIQNVMGLGAALDNLGQSAQVGGTTYSQVITGMFDKTDKYAKIAGMSVKEFTDLLNTDANEAFLRFLEGVNGSDGMGGMVARLGELNLKGARSTQVLGALAVNVDLVRERQRIANVEFEKANSITEEYNTKNNSAQAILEKRKKAIEEQYALMGEKVMPLWSDALGLHGNMLKALTAIIGVIVKYKGAIIGLTAAVLAYTVLQKLRNFYSKEHRALLLAESQAMVGATAKTHLLTAAKLLFTGQVKAATAAVKGLKASFGWLGIISIAIGGIVTALSKVKFGADEATKAQKRLSKASKEMGENVESETALIDSMFRRLDKAKEGTEEYHKAKMAILDKYGDYLSGLDQEIRTLNNVKGAYDAITTAARASIMERMKTQELQTATEVYGRSIHKALEDMDKGLQKAFKKGREEQGKNLLPMVREALEAANTTVLSDQEAALLRVRNVLNTQYGKTGGKAIFSRISGAVQDYIDASELWKNNQAEIERIFGDSYNAASGKANFIQDDDPDGSPFEPKTPKTKGKWSIDKDKRFLEQKLQARKKLHDGEIETEQQYNDLILDLEIDCLERRLKMNIESGENRLKLEGDLADKRYQQTKNEQNRIDKLLSASLKGGGKDDTQQRYQKEEADYNKRLKDLGLFNRTRETMTAQELAALENLERNHTRKLQTIYVDRLTNEFNKKNAEFKRRQNALKIANNAELAEADTFAMKLDLIKKYFSEEDLRRVKNEKQADQLLKKYYQAQEASDARKHLEELKGYYVKMAAEMKAVNDQGIKLGELDPEEVERIQAIIDNINQQLAGLHSSMPGNGAVQKVKVDILGYTADDWDQFFENLAAGENGIQNWSMALGIVGEAFSSINDLMNSLGKRELKNFEKNQNKKKEKLERDKNAGYISEVQYNEKLQALDDETAAKKEELEHKAAIREKALAVFNALINTALGVTAALTIPPPLGIALASTVGALGAVQVAAILATPLPGAEEGGEIGVTREQDGKLYQAKYQPGKRGRIDNPTVLVAEDGPEYVIPNEGYNNPTIRPMLDVIETARRNGTLDSINLPAIMESSIPGRSEGGYMKTSEGITQEYVPAVAETTPVWLERLESNLNQTDETLRKLNDSIDKGLSVSLTGKGGLFAALKKYKSIIENSRA